MATHNHITDGTDLLRLVRLHLWSLAMILCGMFQDVHDERLLPLTLQLLAVTARTLTLLQQASNQGLDDLDTSSTDDRFILVCCY